MNKKPPLGVISKKLWDEQVRVESRKNQVYRIQMVTNAIFNYTKAECLTGDYRVRLLEWIKELEERINTLQIMDNQKDSGG